MFTPWCVQDHCLFMLAKKWRYWLYTDVIIKRKPILALVDATLASRYSPAPDMCHISFTSFVKLRNSVFVMYNSFFFLFVLQHSSLADTTHYVRISKSLYIPYRLVGRGSCACFCIVIQLRRDAKKACAARYIVFQRGHLTLHCGINSRVRCEPETGSRMWPLHKWELW